MKQKGRLFRGGRIGRLVANRRFVVISFLQRFKVEPFLTMRRGTYVTNLSFLIDGLGFVAGTHWHAPLPEVQSI